MLVAGGLPFESALEVEEGYEMPTVGSLLQQEVGKVQVVVRQPPLDAFERVTSRFVIADHGRVRLLIERVQKAALRRARAEPIVELRRPRHRRVDVLDAVHDSQARSQLLADAMLVGEREGAERARRILSGDEVLDVIRDIERALVDVVPAHRGVRNALVPQELGEMQEPAHPTGVRTAVDLEQELLPARRGEDIRVVRSSARPWLDADPGKRAARDLVGRLCDLVLRGRDGERAHGRDESSGAAA